MNLLDETPPMAAMLFLVFFLAFLALLHLATKQRARRPKNKQQQQSAAVGSDIDHDHGRRLPPSPPALPVIGHLHLVGFLPHVALRGLDARYGHDGLLLVRLGSVPTLVVSSPRAAEAVMRTHDHRLASRPPSTSARALLNGSLDVAFAVYGEHWRQAKKLLTTHLLTVRKVQSYRAGREEEVRLAMAKIGDAAAAGRAVDMSELLYAFTTDIMCRAVSGRFFKVGGRARLFRELLNATAGLIGGFNAEDYFPWLLQFGVFRRAICARADKVRRRWDELLDMVIDDHEGKLVQQQEPDFIEVLLSHQHEYGLTRDHLKAMLIDIFFGGTDTSYIVLEFVMAELLRNPRVMSTLQAEIRKCVPEGQQMVTEDDLSGLPYLKAVINETLRLHPPAPLLAPHYSMTDVHVDGYMIPAKIPILVNAWALGRDKSVWEDAEQFKPERFIGMGSDVDINFKGNDFKFLPFGAGRRICPGTNFSISTLEIMVANLMYRFNWEVPPGMGCIDMTEMFRLTVHRKEKLILVPKMHVVV
ncbi:hypothetical protein SETIT_1G132500v2 [Setaria italica]|uniref:Uncharacterized protein n=2 Tax=Setaria italica TaxID=4555 RepID=A0A368PJT0_SETIT|nr:hypothetical protein SETIT_1G132500v2 [Setaria italica]